MEFSLKPLLIRKVAADFSEASAGRECGSVLGIDSGLTGAHVPIFQTHAVYQSHPGH
jgi:hypothetical protein